MYEYLCQIVRVVDGDTFRGDIDLGFGLWLRNGDFRVHHIDAYEKTTAKGKEAIAYARETLEGKTLKVRTTKPDKYGRILTEITLPDGTDYGTAMVSRGFAVFYEGGKKTLPQKD